MITLVSARLVKIITFNFANAIAIFPIVFVRNQQQKEDAVLMNHERIHLRQQMEMLVLPFYLWYAMEYMIRFLRFKNHYLAYRNISFERESFDCQSNLNYLSERKPYSFLFYLKNSVRAR